MHSLTGADVFLVWATCDGRAREGAAVTSGPCAAGIPFVTGRIVTG
ncbi:MAG: hypothetical protein JNM38_13280 [Acidobacteria bacterium]|nr:hypothetical protein [Acidobacteriota bacterium]